MTTTNRTAKKSFESKKKVGKKVIRRAYFSAEDALHLASLVSFQLSNQEQGAYLLKKGNRWQGVVVFELDPLDPGMAETDAESFLRNIVGALKDVPIGESCTLRAISNRQCSQRLEVLGQLRDSCSNEAVQLLATSTMHRTKELADNGIRRPKLLRAYCSIDLSAVEREADSWIEKLILQAATLLNLDGEAEQMSIQRLSRMLQALHRSLNDWQRRFSNKFGMAARALTAEECWSDLWERLNTNEAPPVPQILVLDDHPPYVHEQINHQLHALTLLFQENPILDDSLVRVRGQHVAVCYLDSGPGAYVTFLDQLRYLWDNLLNRDDCFDIEVVAQFTSVSSKIAKLALEQEYKDSRSKARYSNERGSMDAASIVREEEATQAQLQLARGDAVLQSCVVVLVFRNSERELQDACARMTGAFRTPARLLRETSYPHEYYLQALPVCIDKLGSSPVSIRDPHFALSLPGLLPLASSQKIDSSGVELLAREGGAPVLLDLLTSTLHRHALVCAISGGGKSVLDGIFILDALVKGFPVTITDFPKPGGSSTFSYFTHYLGGAYCDTGRESINLLELPDLRHISDPENKAERIDICRQYIATALNVMVLGTETNSDGIDYITKSYCRAYLSLALADFFDDPDIQRRYDAAIEGGVESSAWQEYPCLPDFIECLRRQKERIEEGDEDGLKALRFAITQFESWISSSLGKRLAAPSTIRTDSQLVVFALRNVTDPIEQSVLAAVNLGACLRKAISSKASLMLLDEFNVLFSSGEDIKAFVAFLCVNGRKSGIHVVLSGQSPDSIVMSASGKPSPQGQMILQGLNTKLIGAVAEQALPSYREYLRYREDQIKPNTKFRPDPQQLRTSWLLDDRSKLVQVSYYVPYLLLAATANSPEEEFARDVICRNIPDKHEALSSFARVLVSSIRRGTTPDKLLPEFFPSFQ